MGTIDSNYSDRQREIAKVVHYELVLLRTCTAAACTVYGLSKLMFWVTHLIPIYG